ncbi:MAG: DUF4142 domain-containing protein [Bacteroidota bacterium]
MKKISMFLLGVTVFFFSCTNAGKDGVEKADSTNAANLDTALNQHKVVIDDGSSSFLVRVANTGMAETQMASWEEQKGATAAVQDFATMFYKAHSAINDTVRIIAANKTIILPAALSEDKQNEVNALEKLEGKDLDREFIRVMIKNHQANIDMFEKAMLDAKDPDIRSFADKKLPALKAHLEMAKNLQRKYF